MSPAQPSLVPENKKEPFHMANSPKKPLSAEASAIINSKFSRRALVAGAGALGGAALLSSCSSGGDDAA
jgi:spermidine/putrescine transport system substrate-binding protein